MTTAAVILAGLLAVALVVFVARPFLLDLRRTATEPQPGARELEQLALLEERDRALGALKELEFDHRTGKITDTDYRELVGPLRRDAARIVSALDAWSGGSPGRPDGVTPRPAPVEPTQGRR